MGAEGDGLGQANGLKSGWLLEGVEWQLLGWLLEGGEEHSGRNGGWDLENGL